MEPNVQSNIVNKFSMENYDEDMSRKLGMKNSDYVKDHKEKKVSDFDEKIKILGKKRIYGDEECPPQ